MGKPKIRVLALAALMLASGCTGGEMLRRGDTAPELIARGDSAAKTFDGATVNIAESRTKGPLLLVFLRGFS